MLASIGWDLLRQQPGAKNNAGAATARDEKEANSLAFFPLTMPITAGPGSIAVTLTVGAHDMGTTMVKTLLSQTGTVIGIILVTIAVFLCYRYAERVTGYLGASGKQVIIRLSAFINLCIGIQIISHGVQALMY